MTNSQQKTLSFELIKPTPTSWIKAVLDDFDTFLLDHASCEKKASGMAVSLLSHYPDRKRLVTKMIELSLEEMNHFRQVVAIIHQRNLTLGADSRDPYIHGLKKLVRTSPDYYLLDRLLLAGITEKRGHERFGIVADHLPEGDLKTFYGVITRSEAKHFELFVDLALEYFEADEVYSRLDELLIDESSIMLSLPYTAALH